MTDRDTGIRGTVSCVLIACAATGAWGCGGSEVSEVEPAEATAQTEQQLWGEVLNSRTDPYVRAGVRVTGPAGSCSGTLVTSNKVITAAHCICKSMTEITFANDDGQITYASPRFPIVAYVAVPDAEVCVDDPDDWATLSENDPAYHAPNDIAVLTIGRNADGKLPTDPPSNPSFAPLTPTKFLLGGVAYEIAAGRLRGDYYAVGYGHNAYAGFTANVAECIGCGVRRSGPVGGLVYKNDPCDYDPILGIPLEEDCFLSSMWVAPWAVGGGRTEISQGDSGGGLFAAVGSSDGPYLIGVASNWHESETDRQRWAAIGNHGNFLWNALELPYTVTLDYGKNAAAIYTTYSALVDDRARVVSGANINDGALVVGAGKGGYVRIGVEAKTGSVFAVGDVALADRSVITGGVQTGGTVSGNRAGVRGSIWERYFSVFEPIPKLQIPWAGKGSAFDEIKSPGQTRTPGSYASVNVRAGAKLTLTAGVYRTFRRSAT